jgi:uncharacterized membrane protein YkoI
MQTTIHDEAELWAAAAATGGLSEIDLKAWRDHAAACPACKKLDEEEVAMGMLIKETLRPECPDPGFEQRMVSKFREAYAGNGGRWNEWFRLPPILTAASACFVLLASVAIGLLMKGGEKPSLTTSMNLENEFTSLPPAVQKTVQSQSDGRTVSHIERTDDSGDVSYEIETRASNGEKWGLTVAPDGTLLSAETTLGEIPVAVQAAIKTAVGHGNLEEIDKTYDDGELSYTADITANGQEHDLTFDSDGTLSDEDVNMSDLPPVVQTAINADMGQDKLAGIDKAFDNGKITYEATLSTPGGQEREIILSHEGKLLSREVTLTETPVAVRQTISQTLGDGKLEEIDRSVVAVNHVMPYQIEGQKDGKPFDFMVGPSGNFLGMED